jgi:hypothetical protein
LSNFKEYGEIDGSIRKLNDLSFIIKKSRSKKSNKVKRVYYSKSTLIHGKCSTREGERLLKL